MQLSFFEMVFPKVGGCAVNIFNEVTFVFTPSPVSTKDVCEEGVNPQIIPSFFLSAEHLNPEDEENMTAETLNFGPEW